VIEHLLVALDASPRAPGVLAAAAEIAARFGATLTPLRVLAIPPDFPPAAHVDTRDELPAFLVSEAEEQLKVLVAALPAGRVVNKPMVRLGHDWRTILQVADELDVDLIVIGSHGYHGLDRVLGTTAGKVANSARRSVLVVHDRGEIAASGTSTSSPYRGNG